jgi:type I restriction enzyme S subunit
MAGWYRPYPVYKPSGLEWLGNIPAGWTVLAVKQVAALNPSKSALSHLKQDTVATFLPMEAIGEQGELDVTRTKTIREGIAGFTYVSDEDVLIAKITPCFENGKAAIGAGFENKIAFATTEVIPLRAGEKIQPKFLYRLLTSSPFVKRAEGAMYGAGGQKRVPDPYVASYQFALPSLREQTQIAAFLDHETAKIDALIAKQQRLIALLEEKRQAVISHAVTKGLNPNAPMRLSGIDWLGDVPAHWEAKKLKRVVSVRAGYAFSSASFTDTGKKVIRIGDIDTRGNVALENAKCVPVRSANQFSAFEVTNGDILMAMTGATIGKAGWYLEEEPALLNQRVGAFECEIASISPRFFWYVLKSEGYQKYVALTAFGGAQPNISDTQMLNYPFVLPQLSEQQEISDYLDARNSDFDILADKTLSAINLLKERRTALISAAVTGKIDVRDWHPPAPASHRNTAEETVA